MDTADADRVTADSSREEYSDWSHDLRSLQQFGEELIQQWREQNPHSPRDYPTTEWLVDNGASHLRWILREKHDMGTPEFFVLLTSSRESDEYEWYIDDVATIERASAYLKDSVECRNWKPATKRTNRARINEVTRRFADQFGDENILALLNDPSMESEVYRSFKEVIKDLRNELTSDNSVHQYLRATHRFFEWLERHGRIEYDPMENIEEAFRWDWKSEPAPLTDEQVRRLWDTANSDEDLMLVIGYCIWGIRTRELPEIHKNQFKFKDNDPVIKFGEDDRKNGLGEVSLMFGLNAIAKFLDKRARKPDWDGYLFPSDKGKEPVLSARQARRRFKKLCREENVTVNGDIATPKNGRSFYFNILGKAETDLLGRIAEFAQEQGSIDPTTIRDSYLTTETRRQYRRIFFENRIRRILPDDAYTDFGTSFDRSLAEYLESGGGSK